MALVFLMLILTVILAFSLKNLRPYVSIRFERFLRWCGKPNTRKQRIMNRITVPQRNLVILLTLLSILIVSGFTGIYVLYTRVVGLTGEYTSLTDQIQTFMNQVYGELPAVRFEYRKNYDEEYNRNFQPSGYTEWHDISKKTVTWALENTDSFVEVATLKAEILGLNHIELNQVLTNIVSGEPHQELGGFEVWDLVVLPCLIVRAQYTKVEAWIIVVNWRKIVEGGFMLGWGTYVVQCGTQHILNFETDH